ncbi:hypothetical protein D3C80_1932410 [compost metagenome]
MFALPPTCTTSLPVAPRSTDNVLPGARVRLPPTVIVPAPLPPLLPLPGPLPGDSTPPLFTVTPPALPPMVPVPDNVVPLPMVHWPPTVPVTFRPPPVT